MNDSPYHLQLYSEYMDTSLFPDPAVQKELRDSYIRKYQNLKLDVIITVGPSPLKFMQEVHQKSFSRRSDCFLSADSRGAWALPY